MIPTILSKLSGNVTEAADLMHKAAMHRDTCRDLATWCQEMATSHLGFNSSGRQIHVHPMAVHAQRIHVVAVPHLLIHWEIIPSRFSIALSQARKFNLRNFF